MAMGVAVCRQLALEALRAAGPCIKSAEAVKTEVTKILRILDGSTDGRVKNAAERSALVTALVAFCAARPAHSATHEFAEETTEFLAEFYKRVLRFIAWCLPSIYLFTFELCMSVSHAQTQPACRLATYIYAYKPHLLIS